MIELKKKYNLVIIAKWDDYYEKLANEGFNIINNNLSNSNNIFKEIKLISFYKKIINKIKPDLIINYTIKPHLYGSLVSKNTKIINFVSGVGSVFLRRNLIFYYCLLMYRLIKHKVNLYIFLNDEDLRLFSSLKITKNNYAIVKGEGVELNKFYKYVDFDLPPTFIFVGRLVIEKGIYEYLEAAKIIKNKYPNTRFYVAGAFYNKKSVIDKKLIDDFQKENIITYLGHTYNICEVLKKVHVVVLPSYREGIPISLLEGLASKKFLIASNVPGCKDVCIDGYNGFLVEVKNKDMLARKMEEYILCNEKKLLHEYALNSSYEYSKEFYIEKMVEIIEEVSNCY